MLLGKLPRPHSLPICGHTALPPPVLFLIVPPLTHLCVLSSVRITRSLCDKLIGRVSTFDIYPLGGGLESCPELCSVECVLEMCPRADCVLSTVGSYLPC